MSILSWLTRRRLDLDERDFAGRRSAPISTIAAEERIADGADPETRALRGAQGVRQRHADDGSGPPGVDAAVARGGRATWRSDVRYAVRVAREAPGVRADRGRRAHARHRLERRRLHHAQGHRAHAARRRRRLRPSARRSTARPAAGRALSCRIPTTCTCATTARRSPGSSARPWPTSRSAADAAPARSRRELVTGNYFQVLGVRAQRGRTLLPVGRGRARPPSGGRHQRRAVAARLRRRSRHRRQDRRDQQPPAHRGRRRRRPLSTARSSATTSRCSSR